MTSSNGIVIIGAGVIGTSIAAHLAKRGERPLVLEGAHVCSGTTGQSGGVVRQHYSNPETAALARDALAIFRRWSDHYEGAWLRAGRRAPDRRTRDRSRCSRQRRHAQGARHRNHALLGPDEIAAIDPRVQASDCTTICYEPTAGIADPIETNHAFAATARSLGVEIREGVSVDQIVVESGRVAGLRTSHGDIAADAVVDAAGAWGIVPGGPRSRVADYVFAPPHGPDPPTTGRGRSTPGRTGRPHRLLFPAQGRRDAGRQAWHHARGPECRS